MSENSDSKKGVEKKKEPHWLQKKLFDLAAVLALVILVIVLSILSPRFLTVSNLTNVASQAAINAIVSIGMFMTILTAGIDLSVGSVLALSSMIMAVFSNWFGFNPYLAILIGLASGTLMGFMNGYMLTRLRLPHPFISTLGMMNIARGCALVITAAAPISLFPKPIQFLGNSRIGLLPVSIFLVIFLYISFHLFLTRTSTGRYIYAVGGNKEASRLSGINVNGILNLVYAISGFTAALGGLVMVGRVNSAYPLAGLSYELDAIAAVIIGGASFFGGVGTVGGTLIGVLLIATLRNGLNLLNVDSNFQTVAIGLVIIVAVYVDVLRQQAMKRQ